MQPCIVLFGVKGSGKDTAADQIVKWWERNGMHKASFADPLKRAAQVMFGFSDEVLWGASKLRATPTDIPFDGWCFRCGTQCFGSGDPGPKFWCCGECGETYPFFVDARLILTTLGTEYGRRVHKPIWGRRLFETQAATGEPFVVSDGRFVNEHETAGKHGAFRILLTRGLSESTDTHASEAEVRELADRGHFEAVLGNHEMTVAEMLSELEDALTPWAKQHGFWG